MRARYVYGLRIRKSERYLWPTAGTLVEAKPAINYRPLLDCYLSSSFSALHSFNVPSLFVGYFVTTHLLWFMLFILFHLPEELFLRLSVNLGGSWLKGAFSFPMFPLVLIFDSISVGNIKKPFHSSVACMLLSRAGVTSQNHTPILKCREKLSD